MADEAVSTIWSPEGNEPLIESSETPSPESLDEEPFDFLVDEEGLWEEPPVSTGYFPNYGTSSQLPPYQPEGGDSPLSERPPKCQGSGELQQQEEEGDQSEEESSKEEAQEQSLVSEEEFWPQPGDIPCPIEVIVNVVSSVWSPESNLPLPRSPETQKPDSLDEQPLEQDSCFLTEVEGLWEDSPPSTGYFPYYRTSSHLTACQPEQGNSPRSERPLKSQSSGEISTLTEDQPGTPPAVPSVGSQKSTTPCSPNCLLLCFTSIFKRSPKVTTEPSATPKTSRSLWNIGLRLQRWFRKHRGRVEPNDC